MRLPRFTVRWLMLAVAAVGVVLGAWQRERYRDLRLKYETRATDYAFMEISAEIKGKITDEHWLVQCQEIDRRNRAGEVEWIADDKVPLRHPVSPAVHRRKAAHFALMKAKYRQAARDPWLPVTPDPPEPE